MENILGRYLQKLKIETPDTKSYRNVIERLIQYFRNVQQYPDDEKYFRIKIENKHFQEVWIYTNARQFLFNSGWKISEDKNFLWLPLQSDVDIPLEFLLENRLVKPDVREWIDKPAGIKESKNEELDMSAKIRQHQEYLKFVAEKKEMKKLAENIKADIRADDRRRQELQGKLLIQPTFPKFKPKISKIHKTVPKY